MVIRGTQGYSEQAKELVERYESVAFPRKHEAVLHLLPIAPCLALDIGAGSGADAAWLADNGYKVVAVEPTNEFLSRGRALHPSPSIEWINDSLPHLELVLERRQQFNLVILSAVWMHLDAEERELAMPVVASLLEPNGIILMTLRHGSIPVGRTMFDVSSDETILLAECLGLRTLASVHTQSTQGANRDAGIMWSHLAFERISHA